MGNSEHHEGHILMKLEIKVFPKSSREEIVEKNGITKVYVTAPADKGKANKAVIGLFAKKYGISKSRVSIVFGGTNRKKLVEIKGI